MYKKIAVEDGLTHVTQALQAAGFQTTALDDQSLYNVQALVVKGDSVDMAPEGNLRVPVINAAGRTADEVVDVVRDRLE
ncbi:MAG: YkuS family protein [Desulfitobacteriaceae bacterium]